MDRATAVSIIERLGLTVESAPDPHWPISHLVDAVGSIDYGNGEFASAEELAELRQAIDFLRADHETQAALTAMASKLSTPADFSALPIHPDNVKLRAWAKEHENDPPESDESDDEEE